MSSTARRLHYTYAEYLALEDDEEATLGSVGVRLAVDEICQAGLEDAPTP